LLPMSTLELAELLNQEMVENPMLEEVPSEAEQTQDTPQAQEQAEAAAQKDDGKDAWDDADYEYFFGEYLDEGYRPRQPQEVKELPPIENTLSTKSSLADHLMWQLNLQTADTLTRDIGAAIVGNIDEDGYLVASVNEIAALGTWDVRVVKKALELVQSFDPIGVGARDLQECLLLQLRHLGLAGTPAEALVRDHLRLLQNHRIPELARALNVEPDEVKAHIELIKGLDPRPGPRYSPADSQYVTPAVSVLKT